MIVWKVTWTDPHQGRRIAWAPNETMAKVFLQFAINEIRSVDGPKEDAQPHRIEKLSVPTRIKSDFLEWLNKHAYNDNG